MATYFPKYRVEIGCIDGGSGTTETYRLDIEKKAYAGAVTELNSGPNPIVINYPGGRYPYAPIKPSEIIIELEETSDGDLAEFKSFQDQEYQVKLYNNTSSLRWVGWLTNEQGYREDWSIPNPKRVTIKGIDGLGFLQKREFRSDPLDSTSALRTGRASAHTIIQQALRAYWPDDTSGDYYLYSMLMNSQDGLTPWTNHTGATDVNNPLKKQFWDQTRFMVDKETPMTWFDVLRIILRNNFMFITNGCHAHGWPILMCYRRFNTSTSGESLILLNYNNIQGTITT